MLIERQVDEERKVEVGEKRGGNTSLRRRKNGAVIRPNIMEFVGQPKHKNSTLKDCYLDEQSNDTEKNCLELQRNECCHSSSMIKSNVEESKLTESDEIHRQTNNNYTEQLDNLTNLIRSLLKTDFEVKSEVDVSDITMEEKDKIDEDFPAIRKKRSQSEKVMHSRKIIEWSDEERDHVMCELPNKSHTLKIKRSHPVKKISIARSCSLPETRKSKSKLPGFMSRGRMTNSPNNGYLSSDGEGSGQSMMSFESTSSSSSHGKRSRSASILSRFSRSSPVLDKKSRAGSLITNGTGCPQYFIPGENRGRIFMPKLNLFSADTVCIKGITFRMQKDMPRTHRALSMIGCMGFIVPAPSKYFER